MGLTKERNRKTIATKIPTHLTREVFLEERIPTVSTDRHEIVSHLTHSDLTRRQSWERCLGDTETFRCDGREGREGMSMGGQDFFCHGRR